jgi:hypothetical protein
MSASFCLRLTRHFLPFSKFLPFNDQQDHPFEIWYFLKLNPWNYRMSVLSIPEIDPAALKTVW